MLKFFPAKRLESGKVCLLELPCRPCSLPSRFRPVFQDTHRAETAD
ncbi:MAG: hypothetical protein P1P63_07435 [Treponemataceae bacterium]